MHNHGALARAHGGVAPNRRINSPCTAAGAACVAGSGFAEPLVSEQPTSTVMAASSEKVRQVRFMCSTYAQGDRVDRLQDAPLRS